MSVVKPVLANASHLNGRQVVDAVPTDGQALCWSAADGAYEPTTIGSAAGLAAEIARAEAAEAAITAATVPLVAAPTHHNSTGTAGQFAVDATNFYVCLAANSWVQVSNAGVFSTSF
jgi:hypothetical protein